MSVVMLEEQSGRETLRRNLLIYVPGTIVSLVLLSFPVISLLGGTLGAILPLIVLGLITFAVLTQLVSTLRDLRAEPTFIRGPIQHRWTKGTVLVFFRQHFIKVGREVFGVNAYTWGELLQQDIVEVHYWPHTRTVIRLSLLSGKDADPEIGEQPVLPLEVPAS